MRASSSCHNQCAGSGSKRASLYWGRVGLDTRIPPDRESRKRIGAGQTAPSERRRVLPCWSGAENCLPSGAQLLLLTLRGDGNAPWLGVGGDRDRQGEHTLFVVGLDVIGVEIVA